MAKAEIFGVVVSNKMAKSVVVSIERQVRHGLYGKQQRLTSRFMAHDEENDARVGDRAYELVALHIGLFDCDKRRLALFLDRYGFDSGLRERFVFRCMSMTLLHEFDVLSEVFGRFPAAAQAASLDELATLLWDLDARGLAPKVM